MKFFAAVAALLAVVPFTMGQQPLQVNSLTGVIECDPILITWSGGTPPYFLTLIPAGQPSAPAIKEFPTQQGTSYTWIVDLPAGTAFATQIKDSTGLPAFSGNQQVEAGSSSSCVNTSVLESGTATGDSPTNPAVAAASPTSSGAQSASPSAASTSAGGTAAASGSSATPSATQNAAVRGSSVGVYGLTGLIGLIGAAIF